MMRRILELLSLVTTGLACTAAADPDETFLTAPPGPRPLVVKSAFELRDINEIDEQAETVEFTGTLTLEWKDSRQAFDPAETGFAEKLYHGDFQFNELAPAWYPQVYLANESGTFESNGVLLRVRPDGTSILITPVNATAEINLDMRRFPFDRQQLELSFAVLGFHAGEVVLEAVPTPVPQATISQWSIRGLTSEARIRPSAAGDVSELAVLIRIDRESVFTLRLVTLPLVLIVALSWTVFWMDRSSLGDRLNVSFVGILTAVAFQLVVGDLLPHVSYLTLMHAFLNVSFFVMCAGAVMNLIVAAHEKAGRSEQAHRLDRRCRWLFPLAYLVLLAIGAIIMFLLPPVS